MWEFCGLPSHALDIVAARAFIEDYTGAGGQVTAPERAAYPLLMRAQILWGVLYDLGEAQRAVNAERGLPDDLSYQAGQLAALERLRPIIC